MKVAIVSHNVIVGDGQGRVNVELARYLLSRGVEVTLIADTVEESLLQEGAEWIPVQVGETVDRVDLIKVWLFMLRADRLLRAISNRFDVILGCGVALGEPHAINAVHFVHGTWLRSPYHASRVSSGPNAWYQWLFSMMNARWEKQVFAQAACIVAVSEMVRDELAEIGVPDSKIEVIVNGVDTEEFSPGESQRRTLGLPEDAPLGLFVGDIRSPIKNLDGVLRATAEVPGLHMAVVGELAGSPYPSLAEELGIRDRVHFLGYRREVADIMRSADFFTLPSRRDSCPLVLLEAMASGLPAVVSRNVGTASLVSAEAGFVIETPDDIDVLAKAYSVLASEPEMRTSMSAEARRIAIDHRWSSMGKKYFQLCQQLHERSDREVAA